MLVNGTYFTRLTNANEEEFEVDEKEMEKAFADCLKSLRKYKKYTLKQVSEGTGIPIPTVQRYENGENVPSSAERKRGYALTVFPQGLCLCQRA